MSQCLEVILVAKALVTLQRRLRLMRSAGYVFPNTLIGHVMSRPGSKLSRAACAAGHKTTLVVATRRLATLFGTTDLFLITNSERSTAPSCTDMQQNAAEYIS